MTKELPGRWRPLLYPRIASLITYFEGKMMPDEVPSFLKLVHSYTDPILVDDYVFLLGLYAEGRISNEELEELKQVITRYDIHPSLELLTLCMGTTEEARKWAEYIFSRLRRVRRQELLSYIFRHLIDCEYCQHRISPENIRSKTEAYELPLPEVRGLKVSEDAPEFGSDYAKDELPIDVERWKTFEPFLRKLMQGLEDEDLE